jgi:type II secretion system protein N
MQAKISSWLISWAGYLLYTLLVLICLLWLLFPADTVKNWFEQQMSAWYPNYDWTIETLGIRFPCRLVMENVGVIPSGAQGTPLTIDRIYLSPDIPLLLQKKKALKYSLELLEGSIDGQVVLTAGGKQFEGIGTFDGLHLQQWQILQQSLQRDLDGILLGKFSSKGGCTPGQDIEFQGNLILAGGTLQFKAPILGLDKLPYTAIETDFRFYQGKWNLEQGKLQSSLMNSTFSGSIQVGISLAASQLSLQGLLMPRSEMFAGNENKQMTQIVRTHLQDGGLPYTVNGTLREPSMLFTGSLPHALKSLSGSTK